MPGVTIEVQPARPRTSAPASQQRLKRLELEKTDNDSMLTHLN
ncbi:Unknown protein sequence [Pseudomonas syringae pv. maculicola]|nr:Unknown protein sequence [Pseudomonas syringae pv. maculicola]